MVPSRSRWRLVRCDRQAHGALSITYLRYLHRRSCGMPCKSRVKFVKRFRFKSNDSSELKDSKSFLQFATADLPDEVKIGYLFFRVKQYVPRPLRCCQCNRYRRVAGHCRGKLRCSICGGEHKYSECSAAAPKCPNFGGGHSANDKICPRYKRETEILKLKTEAKLSYADACKAHRIAEVLSFRI